MFDHLHPHNTEHRWGRYWRDATAAQRIPLTDPGRPFRFAYADTNATMAEMTGNLEVAGKTITITTSYDYDWSCNGAISIEGKLYKIQNGITTQTVTDKTYGLAKGLRKRFTIRLMEIPNPVGVR